MLDFLFKCYFSFFRASGDQGAMAGIVLMTTPVSLNVFVVVLVLVSFVVQAMYITSTVFLLIMAAVWLATCFTLRHVYIIRGRYRRLAPIQQPVMYYVSAIMFVMLSVVIFTTGVYLVYTNFHW